MALRSGMDLPVRAHNNILRLRRLFVGYGRHLCEYCASVCTQPHFQFSVYHYSISLAQFYARGFRCAGRVGDFGMGTHCDIPSGAVGCLHQFAISDLGKFCDGATTYGGSDE